jgi:hypothetical protein
MQAACITFVGHSADQPLDRGHDLQATCRLALREVRVNGKKLSANVFWDTLAQQVRAVSGCLSTHRYTSLHPPTGQVQVCSCQQSSQP